MQKLGYWKAPEKRPKRRCIICWEPLPKFKVLYCHSCKADKKRLQKNSTVRKYRKRLYHTNPEWRAKKDKQSREWALKNKEKLKIYNHNYYKKRLLLRCNQSLKNSKNRLVTTPFTNSAPEIKRETVLAV